MSTNRLLAAAVAAGALAMTAIDVLRDQALRVGAKEACGGHHERH